MEGRVDISFYFCILLLYDLVFHFLGSQPTAFQTLKISRVSWDPFRLSKNRVRLRALKPQDLPVPSGPFKLSYLGSFQGPVRCLQNLFMNTRTFLDLKKLFRPPRALL